MAKSKNITDQVLDKIDEFRIGNLLDTKEKHERFKKATKHGYSKEFALIFALQEK